LPAVAAVSAVVERRQASCPLLCPPPQAGEDAGGGSAAPQGAEVTEQRLSAFRFLFLFFRTFVARIERQRNPGTTKKLELPIPDFTSFNPGYPRRTDRDASGRPLPDLI
jgi:hypothetical protein